MSDALKKPRVTNDSSIARMRLSRGLTQKQLAELVGVHKNRVCDWEKGKFKPRGENLLKLCENLNCTIEELIK